MTADLMRPEPACYASDYRQSRGRHLGEKSIGRAGGRAGESDGRTAFQRDRDRIIHCGAFRRLKHKTQVFIYHEGDYFRTRLTHSLEVAQIARAICRQLHLDDDLAEAIALAHDLGHTPFGHAGEDELNKAMQGLGGFDHNEQTIRILIKLEQCYADFDGLNLTWETLEGIAKHNGPVKKPRPTLVALDKDINLEFKTYASLEAQVAALSDDIAYLAHDCDDGIRAGLLNPDDMLELPLAGEILSDLKKRYDTLKLSRLVHELTRKLIRRAVMDLLEESKRRLADSNLRSADDVRHAKTELIAFSPSLKKDLETLRDFLFESVWRHYQVNRMTSKARRVMRQLYELFMDEPNTLPHDWQQLDGTAFKDLSKEGQARLVADYLASMTDRYAIGEHKRLFDSIPIIR